MFVIFLNFQHSEMKMKLELSNIKQKGKDKIQVVDILL